MWHLVHRPRALKPVLQVIDSLLKQLEDDLWRLDSHGSSSHPRPAVLVVKVCLCVEARGATSEATR